LKPLQLIDLNNFKNLLHDSCLVYKKIPERELSESECYVSQNNNNTIIGSLLTNILSILPPAIYTYIGKLLIILYTKYT